MKLNNKGFAITAVLYGLLILFVILVSSYLAILSSKKNRLDRITEKIEYDYTLGGYQRNYYDDDIEYPYTPRYTGKYFFEDGCFAYLYQNVPYTKEEIGCEGKIKYYLYSNYEYDRRPV